MNPLLPRTPSTDGHEAGPSSPGVVPAQRTPPAIDGPAGIDKAAELDRAAGIAGRAEIARSAGIDRVTEVAEVAGPAGIDGLDLPPLPTLRPLSIFRPLSPVPAPPDHAVPLLSRHGEPVVDDPPDPSGAADNPTDPSEAVTGPLPVVGSPAPLGAAVAADVATPATEPAPTDPQPLGGASVLVIGGTPVHREALVGRLAGTAAHVVLQAEDAAAGATNLVGPASRVVVGDRADAQAMLGLAMDAIDADDDLVGVVILPGPLTPGVAFSRPTEEVSDALAAVLSAEVLGTMTALHAVVSRWADTGRRGRIVVVTRDGSAPLSPPTDATHPAGASLAADLVAASLTVVADHLAAHAAGTGVGITTIQARPLGSLDSSADSSTDSSADSSADSARRTAARLADSVVLALGLGFLGGVDGSGLAGPGHGVAGVGRGVAGVGLDPADGFVLRLSF